MGNVAASAFVKSDYEDAFFQVGIHQNEDGDPLVVVDGKCIGTVDGVLGFVGQHRDLGLRSKIATLQARLDALQRDFKNHVIEAVKGARRSNAIA